MNFEQFNSIITQYPLNILYDSSISKEYQYIYPDVCRFLIVKFSIKPNFIEVPYNFRYSKKNKHIVPIDKKHKMATTYFAYKHISNPTEKEVHTEISRLIKKIKQVQNKLKLSNIEKDFK